MPERMTNERKSLPQGQSPKLIENLQLPYSYPSAFILEEMSAHLGFDRFTEKI
jgi:hypothetical protein